MGARLCEAQSASIVGQVDGQFVEVASPGYVPEYDALMKGVVYAPGRGTVGGRALLERKSVQIEDVLSDPDTNLSRSSAWRDTAPYLAFRS